jgi:hypothetical protein
MPGGALRGTGRPGIWQSGSKLPALGQPLARGVRHLPGLAVFSQVPFSEMCKDFFRV